MMSSSGVNGGDIGNGNEPESVDVDIDVVNEFAREMREMIERNANGSSGNNGSSTSNKGRSRERDIFERIDTTYSSFQDGFDIDGDGDDDVDVEALNIEYAPSGGSALRKKKNAVMTAKLLQYPSKSIISKVKRFFTTGKVGPNVTSNSSDKLNSDKTDSTGQSKKSLVRPEGFLNAFLFGGKYLLMGSKMNVLLIALPLAILANPWALHWGDSLVFAFSLIALCPLAERLGFVTEQIANHTNDNIGGLLNATFGNATELIISIFALKEGLLRVVQLSLLGSILSNMLLVLGSGLIAGGVRKSTQYFNQHAVMTSTGLLLMALTSLILPSVLNASESMKNGEASELWLSRFTSFAMLIAYGLYLFFTLKTHKDLMEEKGVPETEKLRRSLTDLSTKGNIPGFVSDAHKRRPENLNETSVISDEDDNETLEMSHIEDTEIEDEEEDDEEEEILGIWDGILWLSVITLIISLLSEWLVDTIESSSASWGISMSFLSTIVLPIVGNAAEHASAIIFAYRDKLDLALGVAIGSSTQIAMFVIPACVLLGWAMGDDLSLNFYIFETTTLFASVLVVTFYIQDGQSNWLKGVVLLLCYIIIGASFYVHQDPALADQMNEGG